MNYLQIIWLLSISVAWMTASPAGAQPLDRRIALEGRVEGVSGPVTLVVELYANATGGARIWGPELHGVTLDPSGRFAIVAGSVTPPIDDPSDGIPDLDQVDPASLFAEMTVLHGGQASVLSPRHQVTPAFAASTSETAETTASAAAGSVDGTRVADDSLLPIHRVAPEGIASTLPAAAVELASVSGPPYAEIVVQSVTLDAPANGHALVSASGVINVDGTNRGEVRCSISGAVTLDLPSSTIIHVRSGYWTERSFALTRRIAATAGSNLFHLVCQTIDATPSTSIINAVDGALAAVYSPTRTGP